MLNMQPPADIVPFKEPHRGPVNNINTRFYSIKD